MVILINIPTECSTLKINKTVIEKQSTKRKMFPWKSKNRASDTKVIINIHTTKVDLKNNIKHIRLPVISYGIYQTPTQTNGTNHCNGLPAVN